MFGPGPLAGAGGIADVATRKAARLATKRKAAVGKRVLSMVCSGWLSVTVAWNLLQEALLFTILGVERNPKKCWLMLQISNWGVAAMSVQTIPRYDADLLTSYSICLKNARSHLRGRVCL